MKNDFTKPLAKMEKLELKEKILLDEYKAIKETSAFGQLPYVGSRALDKAIEQNKKRAIIWNKIRHCIINERYKTLWQLAIEKRLPVKMWSNEEYLDFSTQEIKKILRIDQK